MIDRTPIPAEDEARWYQDAVVYQVHVRAFHDADADGIGDFRGLMAKLDYLQDLGVTTLWLLPFYPSPLRDDGYDIANYKAIHPSYGTLRDFRQFLREAHRLGLRVITELVLNHTSDQHPWFQRARRAPAGSPKRDRYVWSDTPDRYRQARVIFKDFESSNWTWDQVAGAYYWHRFYSHQPDLNFDSPDVRRSILRIVDFWLEMGVDGLRLDAVPYLFEREGTSCENLPQTHAFLKDLRRHVDERFHGRMLLGEANQWPEDAVAYLGEGDECHMAFHFPLMPRMFMSVQMEDRFPIVDILEQTPAIPEPGQWALFLRNHDELTLEMVSDEERDYMYRVYAHDPQARINLGIRRRLAPLLGNNRRVIELMNGLLFSLPGTPVLYYGDEIGMGDNIYLGDRNAVRTPMQWSADRNAGFSRANPQQLYLPVIIDPEYHAEAVNVEAQQNNPNSLLWWMKRLIALRRRYRAFGRGSLEFLFPENRKILVFLRTYGEERILVLANLSRSVQYVELDLSTFEGTVPLELFGGTEFPPIGELPYFLTVAPHSFYWFLLQPQAAPEVGAARRPPAIEVAGPWHSIFGARNRRALEEVLPGYLRGRRWFGGKARRIRSVELVDAIPVAPDGGRRTGVRTPGYLCLVRVEYAEGDPETYVLPLACATVDETAEVLEQRADSVVARLQMREGERALHDALASPAFNDALVDAIGRRRHFVGQVGSVDATPTKAFRRIRGPASEALEPRQMQADQSNSSVLFGDRMVLKLFRRVEEGTNPDLELGRFLTERARFANVPPVAGGLEFRRGRGQPMTVGIVHGFIPNEGDAWALTQDEVARYLELAVTRPPGDLVAEPPPASPLEAASLPPSGLAVETVGTYLASARTLGIRTAELHLALASDAEDPAFAPEPVTPHYQRSLYQSMRGTANRVVQLLGGQRERLPEAGSVADRHQEIVARFRALVETPMSVFRIRNHGDLHLGQVLYTGRDFVIIDFEGEPARPVGERRLKRIAMRDVAGMMRSFHYAAFSPSLGRAGTFLAPEDPSTLEPWMRLWYLTVSGAFLRAYLDTAGEAPFVPRSTEELGVLLDAFLLEKMLYEAAYEANNRPDWLPIPVAAIVELLEAAR
ncbi:MAG TPA: maltose alpha-D-glucosyltransferase [Actinomycetota bacterium]